MTWHAQFAAQPGQESWGLDIQPKPSSGGFHAWAFHLNSSLDPELPDQPEASASLYVMQCNCIVNSWTTPQTYWKLLGWAPIIWVLRSSLFESDVHWKLRITAPDHSHAVNRTGKENQGPRIWSRCLEHHLREMFQQSNQSGAEANRSGWGSWIWRKEGWRRSCQEENTTNPHLKMEGTERENK